MKTIFVILDGAAGSDKEIGNQSCYDVAKTPNLDFFVRNGKAGIVYTVGKGIAPESDVAVFALLGYDPYMHFCGRGPLEAYGAGIELGKDFVAFRTNFATVYGTSIADRRVGRNLTTKEAKSLAKEINKKVNLPCKFVYRSTIGHRGVLVLYGKFKPDISNVDPAYEMQGKFGVAKDKGKMNVQQAKALKHGSERTAKIINSFVSQSMSILSKSKINKKRKSAGLLPANIILPRDAGSSLPKLEQKKKWAAVVAMPLEIGIARLAGMDILNFKYPENKSNDVYKFLYFGLNKTISYSLKYMKRHWNKYENFYIHLKECDIPGHDGLAKEKVKMLELIDRKFFGKVRRFKGCRIIVTSDHATPCNKKSHSDGPVPLLYYDGKGGHDQVSKFSERECKRGSLGIMAGKDVLKLLNI
ncbi:MAG: alkaline phosphatase family protein [Candidatus Woesearchaeota archaeon]